jgi:hypothetical protein
MLLSYTRIAQVREFVASIGHENLTKRLVNSKEGKVQFEKPSMTLDVLMSYGRSLTEEQDNVKRVQLADAYLAGAELAGTDGSSVPEEYEGSKGLNISKPPARSWRETPAAAPAAPPPRAAAPPPPAPAASGDRWSSASRSAPPASAPAPSSAGGSALSASDLAKFKIADLVEIAAKRGVSAGRNATRDSVTAALLKAGVSASDLTKGQLAELRGGGSASPAPASYSAPPAAAPAASAPASGDRWSSYSSGGSSAGGASAGSGTAQLSAGDLSAFKTADLAEIAVKRGVSGGRNATRDTLTSELLRAGVSLADLTRGQLVDLGTKLGKAGLSRDINAARAELASLIGGGGSAPAAWRASPAPAAAAPAANQQPPASWRSSSNSSSSGSAAGGDRWSTYSTGATQAASWRRSGSHNASGSKLSASDLAILRIDDLRDLVKKTGAELPREPTKDSVISALTSKGVSVNDLTRGE